ncbi:DUF4305 domain-containing protein [Texcoconibacillus texcoconensis]|uniref:DUF4305 domain-containing protein n=1 Tax=Texcoconibacillus texcoconensis TaxID=1095777 RepID=A0A840QMR4_9BACI|nr:DUF4305 domain-containing protein [Texcoconibacillus texcoconensis]MBB5172620.1 hypothetical protein [Texcoconibacillus texcoconensis]
MNQSPKSWGFLYFFIGSLFLFLAIQQNSRTDGWDILTIVLMAVATMDYFISIRFFRSGRKKK